MHQAFCAFDLAYEQLGWHSMTNSWPPPLLHMNMQIQSTLLLFCTWFHEFDSPFWIYSYVTILLVCHNIANTQHFQSCIPYNSWYLAAKEVSLLVASNCHLFIFHNRKRSLAMHLCTTAVSITTVLSFE